MENLYYLDVIVRLILAVLLGGLIGLERTVVGKRAGLRTYALVSLGACLFVLVSVVIGSAYVGGENFDPLRVASQIVVGIGFLGAGLIVFQERDNKVQGLTTAAGMWVTAAIGTAVGFGLYAEAAMTAALVLIVFTLLWRVEAKIVSLTAPLVTHREPSHEE